jgi:hypothetical protein
VYEFDHKIDPQIGDNSLPTVSNQSFFESSSAQRRQLVIDNGWLMSSIFDDGPQMGRDTFFFALRHGNPKYKSRIKTGKVKKKIGGKSVQGMSPTKLCIHIFAIACTMEN